MKQTSFAAAFLAMTAATSFGALTVTNGNFQAGSPLVNSSDVPSWFDNGVGGSWWTGTWVGPAVSPNGTSVLGLSYEGGVSGWAYQAIGTNSAGWNNATVTFDVGSFTDAATFNPTGRNIGITVSVFQSSSFVPADGTNIAGAPGVSLISSFNVTTGVLNAGQMLTGLSGVLNLSSANPTDTLYLHFTNFDNGAGEPWAAVDNITIVPEPASALLGGLGLLGLLRRRRA